MRNGRQLVNLESSKRKGRQLNLESSKRFSVEDVDLLYGTESILIISGVKDVDFGNYDVTVVNDYGSDNATIVLLERSKYP